MVYTGLMFYDILLVFILFIYIVVSSRVGAWHTISTLGFPSEAPELFCRNSNIYDAASILLIISAIVVFFVGASIPGCVAIGLLLASWYLSGKLGHKLGFKKYRTIMIEMADFSSSDDEKTQFLKEAEKSDDELLNDALNSAGRTRPHAKMRPPA
jgi:hypothetical protein